MRRRLAEAQTTYAQQPRLEQSPPADPVTAAAAAAERQRAIDTAAAMGWYPIAGDPTRMKHEKTGWTISVAAPHKS